MTDRQKQIVENFVSTIDVQVPKIMHIRNAMRDSFNYKWESGVLSEILTLIEEKYNPKDEVKE